MAHANADNAFLQSVLQGKVSPAKSGTTAYVGLTNRKILVVDDNPINLEIAVETLQDAGAVVASAMNGGEALDHIKTTAFDLVVLDLTMPDIDGHEVGRGIRASANNAKVPLLIFTASDTADAKRAMRDLNAQGIVSKPMDIDDLLSKANEQLQAR
ncbi:MAG: response regulator [Alphaproteobacteria bacterium]|nr:response regulator [Alphaproteobacteria bacterium]